MAQGKRLHLSYERMVMLVDGCPAFKDLSVIEPDIMERIQSISYAFNYNSVRNTEIGSTEYIKHRNTTTGESRIPIISQPTVSLDFNYLLYDATNERKIGFNIGPQGFLNYDGLVTIPGVQPNKLYSRPNWDGTNFDLVPDKGDLNFYILADDTNVRKDIVGNRGGIDFEGMDVLGFGNCYLSNYTISIAVGSFITCSASYLCSNLTYDIFDSTKDILCPAVDGSGNRSSTVVNIPFTKMQDQFVPFPNDEEESLVLRPGDVQVDLINNKPSSDGGFHLIDLNKEDTSIENITFNLPIQRKDINGFGSNYMNDRKMQFPIMCTANLTILTRNFEGLGDISRIFQDDVECDIVATMVVRKEITDSMPGPPDSQGNPTLLKDHFTKSKYIIQERIKMTAKKAKLDSESHSFQIGGLARIEVSFLFEVTPDGGFIVESMQ